MKHPLLPVTAIALAAGLALAGCSSEDSGGSASPMPSTSQSEHSAQPPTGASLVVGTYELTNVWVKESSLDMSGGFGSITNNAEVDDALVAASAPGVPTIELHETVDGVMQQVPRFPIPAGGTLVLAPGGNHLMLMGLTQPLNVGQTIEVTLTFESGETATIEAPIEPFTADDGHGDN